MRYNHIKIFKHNKFHNIHKHDNNDSEYNDDNGVAMNQEAHVGLGIMGKEGRAAVRAADFAFAKFKFLQKMILVHGHWFYYRVSMLIHYFFYKNIACFGNKKSSTKTLI